MRSEFPSDLVAFYNLIWILECDPHKAWGVEADLRLRRTAPLRDLWLSRKKNIACSCCSEPEYGSPTSASLRQIEANTPRDFFFYFYGKSIADLCDLFLWEFLRQFIGLLNLQEPKALKKNLLFDHLQFLPFFCIERRECLDPTAPFKMNKVGSVRSSHLPSKMH